MNATFENALENTRIIRGAIDNRNRSLGRYVCEVEQQRDDLLLTVDCRDDDSTVTKASTRDAIDALIDLVVEGSRIVEARRAVTHSGGFACVWVRGYTLAQAADCCRS